MAPVKSVSLVCLAILAVSSAALGISAADAPSTRPAAAAAEKLGVLSKPLGSGLNSPLSLGRKPKYGRRFLNLMQQLVGAARKGDLKLAQQIQQQLFYVTKLRGHRRHLLQVGFPESWGAAGTRVLAVECSSLGAYNSKVRCSVALTLTAPFVYASRAASEHVPSPDQPRDPRRCSQERHSAHHQERHSTHPQERQYHRASACHPICNDGALCRVPLPKGLCSGQAGRRHRRLPGENTDTHAWRPSRVFSLFLA